MEIWKDIQGYDGMYQVSSYGKVRSLDRIIKYSSGEEVVHKGKILKKELSNWGYERAVLYKDERKKFSVHRLVAETFIDNKEKKSEVNHIDGIKTNNNVENLEWCTPKENQLHSIKIGTRIPKKGENSTNSKLTEKEVIAIRRLANVRKQVELAKCFNVSKQQINSIVKRRTWKHVPEDQQEEITKWNNGNQ